MQIHSREYIHIFIHVTKKKKKILATNKLQKHKLNFKNQKPIFVIIQHYYVMTRF